MTPEQHDAFLDSADAFGTARDHWAEILDALTERGFSISLASVRDHADCETCHGEGGVVDSHDDAVAYLRGDPVNLLPCPGGSPVVWSTEP